MMVAYGAGVNSTAMLAGMVEKGIRPDAILFADTCGEKPETYEYLLKVGAWLLTKGMPQLTIVQNDGSQTTLEQCCLENQALPSIAYGWRTCSDRYKQEPQHKWVRAWQLAIDCWEKGGFVTKCIGIDYGEQHRASIDGDKWYTNEYPLIDWKWGRQECVEAICRVIGLEPPVKSACFFCPASRKAEVLRLAKDHPELFARAVNMERNAKPNLKTVRGLGRNWSWELLVSHDQAQGDLFADVMPVDCMCIGETKDE